MVMYYWTKNLINLFFFAVTHLSKVTGGTAGGYLVTAYGSGLPQNLEKWISSFRDLGARSGNQISFGDVPCVITAADALSVTCIAPEHVRQFYFW